MTASDYVKASTLCTSVSSAYGIDGCFSDTSKQSWIFKEVIKGFSWTISPRSGTTAFNFYIHGSGNFNGNNSYNVSYSSKVFPVFFLSSSIKLKGSGTEGSPYTVN